MRQSENELTEARTRLANAQAEKYELKNAVMRGEYVRVSEVNRAYSKACGDVKNKLLALPAYFAVSLHKLEPREIENEIEKKIYELLREIAGEKLI